MMRVVTDPDAVAKYQAALAELERLEAIPKDERDDEAYRVAVLATRDAFMKVIQS